MKKILIFLCLMSLSAWANLSYVASPGEKIYTVKQAVTIKIGKIFQKTFYTNFEKKYHISKKNKSIQLINQTETNIFFKQNNNIIQQIIRNGSILEMNYMSFPLQVGKKWTSSLSTNFYLDDFDQDKKIDRLKILDSVTIVDSNENNIVQTSTMMKGKMWSSRMFKKTKKEEKSWSKSYISFYKMKADKNKGILEDYYKQEIIFDVSFFNITILIKVKSKLENQN